MQTSTDLGARLLATENLSVVRARTRTASFDIKSRVLTLPLWKDMTPEIEDMLVGHEVGHALYTGEEYLKPIQENRKMQSYLNVLEDVRIEKMIKRKYPGLRKRMNEGYKQLNDRDFFGVKQLGSFDQLLLIDKINLYYKAGFQCGVTFTPEEKQFVLRAERTETIDDVVQLANDVYKFSKEQAEERKKRMQAQNPEDTEEDEDDIFGEDDEEFDDDFFDDFEEEQADVEIEKKPKAMKTKAVNNDKEEVSDEELESKTERAFSRQLEDLADDSTAYSYWKLDPNYHKDTVVGYRKILSETKANWLGDAPSNADIMNQKKIDSEFEKFKTESQRTVNYLVKEFEMKKSAALYKRAQVSKTGSLDMRRVWGYKLNDDLFKRVTVLPQGKNHGMVFLLDWSGSMDGVIEDTLKQVINLAMFCTRIQIPYRVLAFTSQYLDRNKYEAYEQLREFHRNKGTLEGYLTNATGTMHLLEFFSSKMTTSEFNAMAKRVVDRRFQWNDGYSMGGTPLNEALGWIYANLGDYIKENNIEKLSLVTLTDGEGSNLYAIGSGSLSGRTVDTSGGQYKYIKQKHFIREESTQKTYTLTEYAGQQTETILRMIKDRHNVSLVGFYITRNHRRDLQQTLNSHYPGFTGDVYTTIEGWRKEFKDNGFASLQNTGRDEMFLVPQSATKIEEGELTVDGDAKAAAIAKNFSKYLNVKKTSRVLLNRFVAIVA
jgi:hypothetical protein